MRLPLDIDVRIDHSYQEPENTSLFVWDYELLGRALRQMVNLKAFEWSYGETPIFDVNSDVIHPFSNQCILEHVKGRDGLFVSLFDTPILCSNNLISLTLIATDRAFNPGKPIANFLTTCHRLKFWSRPERSFQSISKSSLRIVAIAVKHLSQLTKLAGLFPNVECIDLASDSFENESVTWEGEPPDMNTFLTNLSAFMNLRVILGFRFWDYSETEEMRDTPRSREYLHWVHTLLPCLEFCGVLYEDGIEFIREGNNVKWKWLDLSSSKVLPPLLRACVLGQYDRFAS
ncbi:hypothetical protein Clacol_004990 [Clathrus columnatus]|uniref:Uncharacterized protein n=1 Tax=Clathrus columnatus TaxID=1419009 RepID=A0AAV5AAP0_9AGAM|nr:hypothetical protein Clacol_004990 [Clathrus columnatus]